MVYYLHQFNDENFKLILSRSIYESAPGCCGQTSKELAFMFLMERTLVIYFYVGFRELSHSTRDLSQAKNKMSIVTSWSNAQNGQSCHFE